VLEGTDGKPIAVEPQEAPEGPLVVEEGKVRAWRPESPPGPRYAPHVSVCGTDPARTNLGRTKCVLPCNHEVCMIFGTEEEVRSGGAVLRADGRQAFCPGCGVEREQVCSRLVCDVGCSTCHKPYRVKDPGRIARESTEAWCGQKHPHLARDLAAVGGLQTYDCDIPWIPPRQLPRDRFVAQIGPGRPMLAKATAMHSSWMIAAKWLWPDTPKKSIRERFGIPQDDFLAVTFRIRDTILEEMWARPRQRRKFFTWLAKQDIDAVEMVNFAVWSDMPRFMAFMSLKRMFVCYREQTERGLSVMMQAVPHAPWFFQDYQEDFRQRNGIEFCLISTGTEEKLPGRLVWPKRMISRWGPDVRALVMGPTTLENVAIQRHFFKGREQDLWMGNADAHVRAAHWKLSPGGTLMSKRRMNAAAIFALNIRRWEDILRGFLPPASEAVYPW
jgi:hypothetical protein